MSSRVAWSHTSPGWCTATVDGKFIALLRKSERSWKWLGYANGKPLGEFNGLTEAKREAPKKARET